MKAGRVKCGRAGGVSVARVLAQDQPLPVAADEFEGLAVDEGLGVGPVGLLEAGAGRVPALPDLQLVDVDAERARARQALPALGEPVGMASLPAGWKSGA